MMLFARLCLVFGLAIICEGREWRGSARLSPSKPWVPLTNFAYDTGAGQVRMAAAVLSAAVLDGQNNCFSAVRPSDPMIARTIDGKRTLATNCVILVPSLLNFKMNPCMCFVSRLPRYEAGGVQKYYMICDIIHVLQKCWLPVWVQYFFYRHVCVS